MVDKVVGYKFLNGGANNQKLAAFGIFYKAALSNSGVVLPQIVDFTPGVSGQRILPFGDFFDMQSLQDFLNCINVKLVEADEYEEFTGNDCFKEGAGYFRGLGFIGAIAAADPLASFLKKLELAPHLIQIANALKKELAGLNIELACQLRIERDWQDYSQKTLSSRLSLEEQYNPTFIEILEKICNTPALSRFEKIFICCDEDNLPVSKEEIIEFAMNHYNKRLYFKSCLMNVRAILDTRTALSLIDFEVCTMFKFFVGLTRSTFSNLLCFKTKVAGQNDSQHFIYNYPSADAKLRVDAGCTISPTDAIKTTVRHLSSH